MSTPYPAMSEDGWVTDPIRMGDYLLSDFFLSENSQTSIYKNNVSSLPFLIQSCQGNTTKLVDNTIAMLQSYFTRYFNSVVCQAEVVVDPKVSTYYALNIYLTYLDDQNNRYSIGKIVEIADSKVQKVILANNNG